MSRGSDIILSNNPKGVFKSGVIKGALLPGTLVQVRAVALVNGTPVFEAHAPGTDGYRKVPAVLLADKKQGKGITDAYVDGTQCEVYYPASGEELNLLVGEAAGTSNTFAIGDPFMTDAEDGILVPLSGSVDAFAVCMEVVTQVAGSHLTWCTYAAG